jgi:tetratricopeptide (TPR) repeat protein
LYIEVGAAWEGKRFSDMGAEIVGQMGWNININSSNDNSVEKMSYAESLVSSATVLLHMGIFDNVIDQLESALDIYKKIGDNPNDSLSQKAQRSIATSSILLSNAVSLIKGNNLRALELVDYSLAIRLECFPPRHTLIANAYFHKAKLLAAISGQQNLKDSYELMQQSLDTATARFGSNHPFPLSCTHSLAEIKQSRGIPCGDVPVLLRSTLEQRTALYQAVYDAPWGKEGGNSVSRLECCGNLTKQHPSMAQSYFGLGLNAEIRGELKEAHTLYEEALKIYLAQQVALHEYATGHVGVAGCYLALGNVCRLMSNFGEASTLLDLAAQALRVFFSEDHWKMVECLTIKAELAMDMGKYEEARSQFAPLLKIMTTTYGSSHPITARILQNLKALQGCPSVGMHPVPPDAILSTGVIQVGGHC